MSNAGYNIDEGRKDCFPVMSILKAVFKGWNLKPKGTDEVNYWVNEITNQQQILL